MPRKKKADPGTLLIESVIAGITEKKGKNPVILDFRKLTGTVCDAFVICHGSSRPHTEAIAKSVDETVKKNTGQNPWHQEGFENAEWILIDYGDVVVHIFQEERRKFYNIEQLWADAEITKVDVTE
jgi:ribosome-associated protein